MPGSDGVLKYGDGNPRAIAAAHANFVGAQMQGLSLCTTPIELLSNDGSDTIISRATGFFCRRGGRLVLVTNHHVVSGRNALTGEPLSDKGYFPKRIRYYGANIVTQEPHVHFSRPPYVLDLERDFQELLENPPLINGLEVDVWAVPIVPGSIFEKDPKRTGFVGAAIASCVLDDHLGPPIVTEAGSDCFLLGYPLANYAGLMPPVWKRGSLASEPILGVDNRPMFLIDAAVTSSMSGSPVIRRVVTFAADDREVGALREFTSFDLIGVYAGRLQSMALERVNLGYAWHKSLIDGVLAHYDYGLLVPS
jgi:hypothetical protein